MIKATIIYDKNKISKKIFKIVSKKIKLVKINNSSLIIVIGGDGFMLQTLKKYHKFKLPFYGINSGNYGFLMNKFSSRDIVKNFSNINMISISPLEMIVRNKNNQIKKAIAINEVSVLRQSRQAAIIYRARL